jgi:hypothetical protein
MALDDGELALIRQALWQIARQRGTEQQLGTVLFQRLQRYRALIQRIEAELAARGVKQQEPDE